MIKFYLNKTDKSIHLQIIEQSLSLHDLKRTLKSRIIIFSRYVSEIVVYETPFLNVSIMDSP